jgi:hypothetical protein
MKKDLGDHIGKKKGWAWYELFELIKLAFKNPQVIVAPHFVNTDGFGNTKMLSVYDSDIHYSAHKALQEALIRIEELERRLNIN